MNSPIVNHPLNSSSHNFQKESERERESKENLIELIELK